MLKRHHREYTSLFLGLLIALLGFAGHSPQVQGAVQSIEVSATVPELGNLVREVGGDQVAVTVFAKGTEDPHFVEAKPSFIKELSQDELYVQAGMDLEVGWAPVLLQNARNAR